LGRELKIELAGEEKSLVIIIIDCIYNSPEHAG